MTARIVPILLVCLLCVPAALTAPATANASRIDATADASLAAENASVSNVTLSGTGVYENPHDNGTYVWQGEPSNITATVQTGNTSSRNYEACVNLPSAAEDERELVCTSSRIPGNTTQTVTLTVTSWPDTPTNESTTEQPLVVRFAKSFNGGDIGTASTTVHIVSKDGNLDGDDLPNGREAELGTDITRKDTDGDGLWDDEEVRSHNTDPLAKDSDSDALLDAREVTRNTDPNDPDTDGDGLLDGAEVDDYDTNPRSPDSDDDGLMDGAEVNDYETGPTNPDTDNDGLQDGAEVHTYGTDATNPDTDGDMLSDGTEVTLGSDPNNALMPALAAILLAAAPAAATWMYVTGAEVHLEDRTYFDRDVTVPTVVMPEKTDSDDPPARPQETAAVPTGAAANNFDAQNQEAFLADEDRICRLLDDAGGYLRQQAIVNETGWSKSKVSRLLSRMESEEQVTKINVGRENIISLPGEEPPGAKSALEED